MELDNIEKLLEKYFEATTTVDEERKLREYFSQDDVATHLQQYRPMFNYFSNAKEEKYTKQVPLKPRVNYYKWLSVAAAVVLTFGIYFGKQYQDRKQRELEQAEYAYQETKKAFELLAENFGRGTEKVAYLKEFEEAKQKIYNNN
ncbi:MULTISPECIES: hypothetical protein [Flagellimonas]|uniref:Uncharacterized protein n=1 Tax=Flagellimonas hadalis TaxID=2597517 RepID=A0A5N5IZ62_9FLAO|nr:hypothetical protein [Allomuricauda hadalis]KAB5491978.1 hypothetical protein FOT42_003230 [Allomuricauda hadalis]RUA12238.1 MAG: hypothetical protein DSY83_14985 [Flavobacteriia bacterium]